MFEEDFIWYPIYSNEFEKSTLLTDMGELEGDFYIDEDGVKKRRGGHNLKNLEISEISLCRAGKVNVKYLIQKGKGDDEMDEEKELRGWEDVSESELTTIRETISILGKYDLVADLEKAKESLTKYFGEGTEVKKYDDKIEWSSVQRCVFGYDEDDLSMVSESGIYEIEKSNEGSKWPSLTRQFDLNKRRLEKRYEERELESRAV